MRGFLYALTFAIAISFVLGFLWSKDFFTSKRNERTKAAATRPVLVITTYRGWVPEAVVEAIEAQTQFQVRLEEFDRALEVWQKLERAYTEGTAELITLTSWQIEVARQLGRVQEVPDTGACRSYRQGVAADFRALPDRPGASLGLPLAWAATGFLINTDIIKVPPDSLVEVIKKFGRGKSPIQLMRHPEELVWLAGQLTPASRDVEEGETDESESRALENIRKSLKTVLQSAELVSADNLRSPFTRWNPTADLSGKSAVQANHTAKVLPPFQGQDKWQFVLPKEKGLLWVGYLVPKVGIMEETQVLNLCSAMKVISDQMSTETVANRFIENTGLALTFSKLNSAAIPAEFKPAHIRSLPLNRMDLRKNFAGDSTVESILEEGGKDAH